MRAVTGSSLSKQLCEASTPKQLAYKQLYPEKLISLTHLSET